MSQSKPLIVFSFANDHNDKLVHLTREKQNLLDLVRDARKKQWCEYDIFDGIDRAELRRYANLNGDDIVIFYYAGHATERGLWLEREDGGNESADNQGLATMLGQMPQLQLVFLNACATKEICEAILEAGVPIVIGTHTPVSDELAANLAKSFFMQLVQGKSVQECWDKATSTLLPTAGAGGHRMILWDNVVPDLADDVASIYGMFTDPNQQQRLSWNLPAAAHDHLFDLPIGKSYQDAFEETIRNGQARPFKGLERYQPQDAPLFFGRDQAIRDVYNLLQRPKPVIFIHGMAGVGKSSLLQAGLIPRIDEQYHVQYVRRKRESTLSAAFEQALLAEGADVAQLTAQSIEPDGDLQKAIDEVKQELVQNEQALMAIMEDGEPEDLVKRATIRGFEETIEEKQTHLKDLEAQLHAPPQSVWLRAWLSIEAAYQKPFVVILDQVERPYAWTKNQHSRQASVEVETFFSSLQEIFTYAGTQPQGHLILASRTPYHDQIQAELDKHDIPNNPYPLAPLTEQEMEAVIMQPTTFPTFNLSLTEMEGRRVVQSLREDKDSLTTTFLQLFLFHTWHAWAAQAEAGGRTFDWPFVSEQLTQEAWLASFIEHEMTRLGPIKLDRKVPGQELIDSGLAYDLLQVFTLEEEWQTFLTASVLEEVYAEQKEAIQLLLRFFVENSLLMVDIVEGELGYRLGFHRLEAAVREQIGRSKYPAQIASRILDQALSNQLELSLSQVLAVQQGIPFRRRFSQAEQDIFIQSRKQIPAKDLRAFSLECLMQQQEQTAINVLSQYMVDRKLPESEVYGDSKFKKDIDAVANGYETLRTQKQKGLISFVDELKQRQIIIELVNKIWDDFGEAERMLLKQDWLANEWEEDNLQTIAVGLQEFSLGYEKYGLNSADDTPAFSPLADKLRLANDLQFQLQSLVDRLHRLQNEASSMLIQDYVWIENRVRETLFDLLVQILGEDIAPRNPYVVRSKYELDESELDTMIKELADLGLEISEEENDQHQLETLLEEDKIEEALPIIGGYCETDADIKCHSLLQNRLRRLTQLQAAGFGDKLPHKDQIYRVERDKIKLEMVQLLQEVNPDLGLQMESYAAPSPSASLAFSASLVSQRIRPFVENGLKTSIYQGRYLDTIDFLIKFPPQTLQEVGFWQAEDQTQDEDYSLTMLQLEHKRFLDRCKAGVYNVNERLNFQDNHWLELFQKLALLNQGSSISLTDPQKNQLKALIEQRKFPEIFAWLRPVFFETPLQSFGDPIILIPRLGTYLAAIEFKALHEEEIQVEGSRLIQDLQFQFGFETPLTKNLLDQGKIETVPLEESYDCLQAARTAMNASEGQDLDRMKQALASLAGLAPHLPAELREDIMHELTDAHQLNIEKGLGVIYQQDLHRRTNNLHDNIWRYIRELESIDFTANTKSSY